jgi:hypothetical protein
MTTDPVVVICALIQAGQQSATRSAHPNFNMIMAP